jgi:hypothetical protein
MLYRIAAIAIAGAIFVVCLQFTQVLFFAWAFDDFVKDEVKFAPLRDTKKERLIGHIREKAQGNGLTLDPQLVHYQKYFDSATGIRTLAVDVDYTAPVDLFYLTYPMKRRLHASTNY